MQRLYGSNHDRRGPLAWLALCIGVSVAAAEALAQQAGVRTVEGLPTAAWVILIVYCFCGWAAGNLKPLVVAMNGEEDRCVTLAGAVSGLIAAFIVGVSAGLWVLVEARYDGKALGALYGYFAAGIGGFGGVKFLELALEVIKTIALKWAQRDGRKE